MPLDCCNVKQGSFRHQARESTYASCAAIKLRILTCMGFYRTSHVVLRIVACMGLHKQNMEKEWSWCSALPMQGGGAVC